MAAALSSRGKFIGVDPRPGSGETVAPKSRHSFMQLDAHVTARITDLMGDARMTAICRRFNARMMKFQSVHHPDRFDMGYGYNRDAQGMVNCSCASI